MEISTRLVPQLKLTPAKTTLAVNVAKATGLTTIEEVLAKKQKHNSKDPRSKALLHFIVLLALVVLKKRRQYI